MAIKDGILSLFTLIFQEFLVDQGYPITLNGQIDPATQKAWDGYCVKIGNDNREAPTLSTVPKHVADWITARYYSHHQGEARQASIAKTERKEAKRDQRYHRAVISNFNREVQLADAAIEAAGPNEDPKQFAEEVEKRRPGASSAMSENAPDQSGYNNPFRVRGGSNPT